MSQHSQIGPSSCERYWNCPGSITVFGDLPELPTTFSSAEGTAAHSIAEGFLRQRKRVDNSMLGTLIDVEGYTIEVDEAMCEAVSCYVDYVLSNFESRELSDDKLMVEVRFALRHIDPELFGTGDAIIEVPWDRLTVYDYKHGAGHAVEAEQNKQTLCYALGAYYEIPEIDREFIDFVDTVIIQPRCSHHQGVVRTATYTVAELLEFEKELRAAIKRVRDGDRTLKAGRHCKFCKAQSVCGEARNAVQQLAQIDFEDVESHPIEPVGLTPEALAHLLGFLPQIREWCNSIETRAFILADKGIELPGYQLVSKQGHRKWVNEQAVIDFLDFDFGDRIYSKPKLLSPNQIERLLPKKERFQLAPFWEKPESGKTLAKVKDRREPRLSSSIADFLDV